MLEEVTLNSLLTIKRLCLRFKRKGNKALKSKMITSRDQKDGNSVAREECRSESQREGSKTSMSRELLATSRASQGQSIESVKVLQPLKDIGKRNRKLTLLKSRLYFEEMGYKDDYYFTSIIYSIYS